MLYLLYLPVLTFLLLLYFRFAVKLKIIDMPNQRSSHSRFTVRGGGIIFPVAILLQFLIGGFDYPMFISGLLLIGMVSFYDDLRPLSSRIRLLVHLAAVSVLFMQVGLMTQSLLIIGLAYILVIGTINAYNFMDGINGITGSYSLITVLTLYFINETITPFVFSEWLIVTIMAVLVFIFFNFRKRAKCFAGDVGSVSMAFIIIFFILLLILKSADIKYIALLLLYGLDTVTTIIFRLIRRENIFEAHRSHLYQYLVNVKKWQHISVAMLYALIQLIINCLLLTFSFHLIEFLILLFFAGLVFVALRFNSEGKSYLLNRKTESQ